MAGCRCCEFEKEEAQIMVAPSRLECYEHVVVAQLTTFFTSSTTRLGCQAPQTTRTLPLPSDLLPSTQHLHSYQLEHKISEVHVIFLIGQVRRFTEVFGRATTVVGGLLPFLAVESAILGGLSRS